MKKKKTVAYLTRHAVSNYGSLLQAYATQTALEKLGANAVCIDYYRTDEKTENLVDTRLKMHSLVLFLKQLKIPYINLRISDLQSTEKSLR